MRRAAALGLLLFACKAGPQASPAAGSGEDATRYYPLAVGNSWTYSFRGSDRRETIQIVGRDDRQRATTPAEQAWGQPAGTLRFAPPPGPTVATAPKESETAPESAPPDEPEKESEGEGDSGAQ